MPDYEMNQQDKTILQMTRNGLTSENAATGECKNISHKKVDCEFHKQDDIEAAFKTENEFFEPDSSNLDKEQSSTAEGSATAASKTDEEENEEEYQSPYSHGEYHIKVDDSLQNTKEMIEYAIYDYKTSLYYENKKRYELDQKKQEKQELGSGNQKQELKRDSSDERKKNFKRDIEEDDKNENFEFSRSCKRKGSKGQGTSSPSENSQSINGKSKNKQRENREERRFDKYSRRIEKTDEKVKRLYGRLQFDRADSGSKLKFNQEYLEAKQLTKKLWNSWAKSRRENRDMMPASMMSTTRKGIQNAKSISRKWNKSVKTIQRYTNPYARLEREENRAKNYRLRRDEEDYKHLSPNRKKIQKMMQKKRYQKIAMKNRMLKGQENYVQHRKFIIKAKDAAVKVARAVKTVVSLAGSAAALVIIAFGLLLGGGFFLAVCLGYGGDAIIESTYQADYSQISDCSTYMKLLETDLEETIYKIKKEEKEDPKYFEYIYDLGDIGHNSIELISYLAAKFVEFDLNKCQEEINELFKEMYTLKIESKKELREREKSDEEGNIIYDEEGNPVIEEFMAQICYVTLKVKPLEEIIEKRLNAEQRKYYDTYMLSSGGQQVYLNCLDVNWTNSISSKFGERIHPITGKRTFHNGIDIAVPLGTELYSSSPGTITTSAYSESAGNYVVVTMENGWSVTYMHLDSRNVAAGDIVEKGQVLGETGNSGNSTGPHLHLEVRTAEPERKPIDPTFMIPSSSSAKN